MDKNDVLNWFDLVSNAYYQAWRNEHIDDGDYREIETHFEMIKSVALDAIWED